ncbi:MAG: outer membrane beta-barrel protein [Bacteroidetes bacterium]|nr:outer membrane beta-barrel protein [Bacteroidota bacterium]
MRKIIAAILLFGTASVCMAQPDKNIDFRKHFFWGIAFCGTQAKMKMKLSPEFYKRTDSLSSIKPLGQAGGGFGGTVAYKFGRDRKMEVKAQTMLQLHQRNLQYNWAHTAGPNLKIESISFDLPVDLKYYSDMPKKTRFYVLGGLRYSYDFQSNQGVVIGNSKPLVAVKKNTWYYEYGAGFEFRLDFVDMSLELRMSNGLSNALVRVPDSYYSGSLQSIFPRLFSISLMAQN